MRRFINTLDNFKGFTEGKIYHALDERSKYYPKWITVTDDFGVNRELHLEWCIFLPVSLDLGVII